MLLRQHKPHNSRAARLTGSKKTALMRTGRAWEGNQCCALQVKCKINWKWCVLWAQAGTDTHMPRDLCLREHSVLCAQQKTLSESSIWDLRRNGGTHLCAGTMFAPMDRPRPECAGVGVLLSSLCMGVPIRSDKPRPCWGCRTSTGKGGEGGEWEVVKEMICKGALHDHDYLHITG